MIEQLEITLPDLGRGIHLVTDKVLNSLPNLPQNGLLHLFIKHTSAGITINENCDPSVRRDFAKYLDKYVPENEPYFEHTAEGPDDMPAHIKGSLVGFDITIPIQNGRPALGTWQGIYLCEFRNHGGSRRLLATIYS
jgi:secondary thiamine-phosphate synthase enzyme